MRMRTNVISLVPRPFFAGEEKWAWYNLFAHARDRIRVDIFRVLAPLYSRICTTEVRCLRMLLPIVSEQTLYKTRVYALCTRTYVAMLHVHIVRD